MVPVALFHNYSIDHILVQFAEPNRIYLGYLEKIVNIALFLLVYRLYVTWIEKRTADEIKLRGSIQESCAGFMIGAGIIAVMVFGLSISGYYRIDSIGENPRVLLDAFLGRGTDAFVEELFIRIIFFCLLEKLLGTWYSLIAVACVFGLGHISNPNATLWSSAALMVSDVLLTGAFVLTRRLWLVWGIHFGWNYLQDGVFGLANSGVTELDSWITPIISGPGFITGGSFGLEASLVAVTLQVAIGIWLLKAAMARKQIIAPVWIRKRTGIQASAGFQ